LEDKLEITLNFLKKIITFTGKLVPQIIVISYSKEEVEVRPQFVVEEQPQPVIESRLVEEKELQQLVKIEEVFFQELFEEGPISNIIP
jgi:hypothetical protein